MDLNNKSKENIALCEMCVNLDKFYNVTGSRIYYALFQKLKYILLINNFDYTRFLQRYFPGRNERRYSHGTIRLAFVEFLQNTINAGVEIMMLFAQHYRDIYRFRIKSDYDDYECNKNEYEEYLKNVKEIINKIEEIVEI